MRTYLLMGLLGVVAVLVAGVFSVARPPVSSAAGPAVTALATAPNIAATDYALPPNPNHTSKVPLGIAAGPDGNIWFTEAFASAIGRITPAGVITEYRLPMANSYPRGITRGPDGNLWFVEQTGNQVGRITPAGAIAEYTLPTADSAPMGIALGSDGNLWFTECLANQIGRITPSGQVTEYPISLAGFNPRSITAGPDGNLWFTTGGGVGRITPAGQVTEYPGIPCPHSITGGPDGNIWVAEASAQIAKLTPGGVLTEYPLPDGIWVSEAITSGADGNLWFLAIHGNGTNELGRVTPAGQILTVGLPGLANATLDAEMTTGPGGTLWFTNPLVDQIWRVDDLGNLPTPTPTLPPTSTPTPRCPGAYFMDVCRQAWYYSWVTDLVQLGAISGYDCGGPGEPCDEQRRPYFRPNADITRGQLTKATIVSAGIPISSTGQVFADVPPGNAFYSYVNTAFAFNIVDGYDCGGPGEPCDAEHRPYFRPFNSITRGQASKIIALTHGWALLDPPEPSFDDVSNRHPFYTYIETIRAAGTISGYDCGGPGEPCDAQQRPYFRPGNYITRAQAAKILDLARSQAPPTPTPATTETGTPTATSTGTPTATSAGTPTTTSTGTPTATSTGTPTTTSTGTPTATSTGTPTAAVGLP